MAILRSLEKSRHFCAVCRGAADKANAERMGNVLIEEINKISVDRLLLLDGQPERKKPCLEISDGSVNCRYRVGSEYLRLPPNAYIPTPGLPLQMDESVMMGEEFIGGEPSTGPEISSPVEVSMTRAGLKTSSEGADSAAIVNISVWFTFVGK
jgi:hypothetical protein